jgi:hypothetical protein
MPMPPVGGSTSASPKAIFASMATLLLTPPLVQSNTPYPATPYLYGILARQGLAVVQADASLMLLLRLFSSAGLERIRQAMGPRRPHSAIGRFFRRHARAYATAVEPAVRFLQGRAPNLGPRIASRKYLPEGPRFEVLAAMAQAGVGLPEIQAERDFALYLASLFIDDLADCICQEIDARFGLARYAESLGLGLAHFEPLRAALQAPPTLIDTMIDEITDELIERHRPGFIGLTVPFPGNLYAALRMARRAKMRSPATPIAIGGGYVNTELRWLAEPALFDFVDYVCLDDGGLPLQRAIEHAAGQRPATELVRCFARPNDVVVFTDSADAQDPPHSACGPPSYTGLAMNDYFCMAETLNPMHALWSKAKWNKLMLAHGCYWRKCAFCDTTLDYIRRFDPAPAATIADWIEAVMAQTGQNGFHFVDEAMPPGLVGRLAREIIRRKLEITWWGNIRFEKGFTPELAALLARSGCIAVSGGLEAPQARLLRLLVKGIDLPTAGRAMHACASAGILVHAYLMYAIPGQTRQETVDSLECVRQLFAAGCLHSAYWHRFAATVHSTIGREARKYGLTVAEGASTFARNDLIFRDDSGVDHDVLGNGLKKAVYNFMHGIGLEEDVRLWFEGPMPRPRIQRRFIASLTAAGDIYLKMKTRRPVQKARKAE